MTEWSKAITVGRSGAYSFEVTPPVTAASRVIGRSSALAGLDDDGDGGE